MKLFKDRKEKRNIIKEKGNNKFFSYLPLLISMGISFFVFFFTRQMMIALSVMLNGLCITLISEEKNNSFRKQMDNGGFYQTFLRESAMEKSYLLGFQKAVDNMPLSEEKDRFLDYIDSNYQKEFPISSVANTQEVNLLQTIHLILYNKEEYCFETTTILLNKLKVYKDEHTSNKDKNYIILSLISYFLFYILIFFGILYYA